MTTSARSIVAPLLVAVACALQAAEGQEFRVFTEVTDLSAPDGAARPPIRAVTLFHAGKVYDHLDVTGEVVVYEPTKRRFRILNTSQGLVASAAFDEIQKHLTDARALTAKQAAKLAGRADPEAARAAALLRFQLDPPFEESFDQKTGLLTLDGGAVRYAVRAADPGRPDVANNYLDYADWTCRLNYVLHPGLVLPEPRLALNQALRGRGLVPEAVEQTIAVTPEMHRRAKHTIHFDLNAEDRSLIHQWELQLKSPTIREVPLREYQRRTMLTAKAR